MKSSKCEHELNGVGALGSCKNTFFLIASKNFYQVAPFPPKMTQKKLFLQKNFSAAKMRFPLNWKNEKVVPVYVPSRKRSRFDRNSFRRSGFFTGGGETIPSRGEWRPHTKVKRPLNVLWRCCLEAVSWNPEETHSLQDRVLEQWALSLKFLNIAVATVAQMVKHLEMRSLEGVQLTWVWFPVRS